VPFDGHEPDVNQQAFVADGATLVGAVTLAAGASVWFGAVIRADGAPISVGKNSNVQDGCVLHSDPGFAVTIGAGVSLGHGAVVHGCTIGDDALIGMGAVVLNGGSLVAGVPGQVRRAVSEAEAARVRDGAASYVERAARYAAPRDVAPDAT